MGAVVLAMSVMFVLVILAFLYMWNKLASLNDAAINEYLDKEYAQQQDQPAGFCECGHAEGQHDTFIGCTIAPCDCVEGYGNNPDPYSDPQPYERDGLDILDYLTRPSDQTE